MSDSGTGLVFVIGEAEYPAPMLNSFDMAERRVMFDLAGIVEEDFLREFDETEDEHRVRERNLTRHPGFMEALMHIAYARGNPDVKQKDVQALIDRTNYQEAIQKWGEATETDDANPPASESTSEQDEPSPSVTIDSNTTSGKGSSESSDQPAETPASTGTTGSDTSATSARSLQAV